MLVSLLYITFSCVVIWRSSKGFEIASDYLGRKMPLGIKGATLNAIASSMPEFLTTIFFLFYLRDAEGFSGGLGVTSGSALFNLLIIPALVVLILLSSGKKRTIVLNKKVLMREGLVLLVSQVVFVNFLFRGELLAIHGLILVVIYLLLPGAPVDHHPKEGDPRSRLRHLPWKKTTDRCCIACSHWISPG
jgi:cation:H+ antiporter